jgi:hypothetical protein
MDQHSWQGTKWLDLMVEVDERDYFVRTKKRLSAFYPTDLEFLLFQILQQVTQQGSQLISTALQGLGLSGQAYSSAGKIYSSLMETQMKQDQSVLSSIGNFANALGNVFGKVAPAAIAAL